MGRLIDCNDVYDAIQITADDFGVLKGVFESKMLTMLSKIETVEAIPKDQYEARLKADTVVILNKIRAEITDCLKALDDIEKSGVANYIYLPNEITGRRLTYQQCLEFIDKYTSESEEKECG